jgi:tRNA A-37 threonylcarbamoyl transferase component Bud32
LPRHLQTSGRIWLAGAGLVFLLLLLVGLITNLDVRIDRADAAIIRWVAGGRSDALTSFMQTVHALGSDWTVGALRWAVLIALIVFKRFRHLFVFLGSVLAVGWVTTVISQFAVRARPVGVAILGPWEGGSLPSKPVATLAVTLIGIAYTLVVPGRPRTVAKWITGALVVALGVARLYLAVDHPPDFVMGAVLGIAIPVVAFRLLTPNEVFPVSYRRGRAAHLDVGGTRGKAIRRALEDQLGISVVDMQPFGLAGSGGSTPLRLRVGGDPDSYLFAKLYAANHLRADRWYKLGRTLLYGRLEDEASFSTVRRLVQYEDYMLMVMRKAGLSTPEPYGFVEITPEREYLVVTEFIEGAKELLDVDPDDAVIDDALKLVRNMWESGIAHRDIKPSNLLARDGKVHLIDVAFGQVRPSPWRQAVDLANMMLVLALGTDPDRVYARALNFFTHDEIAEAFAATHSVTMPSQSRSMLRKDRRNLLARFRELAPSRRPISIQRWSLRRVTLTVGVFLVCLIATLVVMVNLGGAGLLTTQASHAVVTRPPECGRFFGGEQLVLEAQSVPTASQLPCLDSLPPSWHFRALQVRNGSSELILDYFGAGAPQTVSATLGKRCDLAGAAEVPSDEPGTRRYDDDEIAGDRYIESFPVSSARYYTFEGGCVVYRFGFSGEGRAALATEASSALGFTSRAGVEERYHRSTGLDL